MKRILFFAALMFSFGAKAETPDSGFSIEPTFNHKKPSGLKIVQITEIEKCISKAGVIKDDVIVAIGKQNTLDVPSFMKAYREELRRPEVVPLKVKRENKVLTLQSRGCEKL